MKFIDRKRSTLNLTVIDTDRVGVLIKDMEQIREIGKLDMEIKVQLVKVEFYL